LERRHTQYYRREKSAYLNYPQTKSAKDRADCKRKCDTAKKEIRNINRKSWDKYIRNIQYDVHGAQNAAFKIIKHLNKSERDTIFMNNIREEDWRNLYKKLWTIPYNAGEYTPYMEDTDDVDSIHFDEFNEVLYSFKYRKSPGYDGINMELLKSLRLE
jgi:hypothetical protein